MAGPDSKGPSTGGGGAHNAGGSTGSGSGSMAGKGGERRGGNIGKGTSAGSKGKTSSAAGGGPKGSFSNIGNPNARTTNLGPPGKYTGRMTGAPGTGVGPGYGANSLSQMADAASSDFGGWLAKTFTPLGEYALTTDAIKKLAMQGKPIPRGAQWGVDPIGFGASILGGQLAPGAGLATGYLGGEISKSLGYPAGIIGFGDKFGNDLSWNKGSDYVSGGGLFGGGSLSGGMQSSGSNLGSMSMGGNSTRPGGGSLTPGISNGRPGGTARPAGGQGSNRQPQSVSGYIAKLMGMAA